MFTFAKISKSMNARKLLDETIEKITLAESREELRELALLLLEYATGLHRTEMLAGKMVALDADALARIEEGIVRLNRGEPIQYLTGTAWFYGRTFKVTPAVLIPRPETEELIDVVKTLFDAHTPFEAMDAGTGSGCIAITLKLELPLCNVFALDISPEALEVARHNARVLQASVQLMQGNMLQEIALASSSLDLLISNPPYIAEREINSVGINVARYEPHQALFVPGNDPLLFYRALAENGKRLLKKNGWMVAEIHAHRGPEAARLFTLANYQNVRIIKDLSGHDRIIMAQKA
jgi:release factor glutamine methyltransferase